MKNSRQSTRFTQPGIVDSGPFRHNPGEGPPFDVVRSAIGRCRQLVYTPTMGWSSELLIQPTSRVVARRRLASTILQDVGNRRIRLRPIFAVKLENAPDAKERDMTSRSGRPRTPSGFTLLELMIVLLIIAGIMGIALPELLRTQQKAKIRTSKVQMGTFDQGLKDYFVDNSTYPTTEQGIVALWAQPQPSAAVVGGVSTTMAGPGMGATGVMPMGGPGQDPTMGGLGGMDPTMGGMGGMADPTMPGMGGAVVPTTTARPQVASSVQNWAGPYLEGRDVPLDPWGNPYHYEYPSTRRTDNFPAIWSDGPDKEDITDDVPSWDPAVEGQPTSNGTGAMTNPLTGLPTDGTQVNPLGGTDMMGGMPTDPGLGGFPADPGLGGMPNDPGLGGLPNDPGLGGSPFPPTP